MMNRYKIHFKYLFKNKVGNLDPDPWNLDSYNL